MNVFNFSLSLNLEPFLNDITDLIRAFEPYIVVDDNSPNNLKIDSIDNNDKYICIVSFNGNQKKLSLKKTNNILDDKRKFKKNIKNHIYILLKDITNISLPYGSLTGVRPTIVARQSKDLSIASKFLAEEYYVSKSRADLLQDIINNQKNIYEKKQENACLYINIPFCPSRCTYCTFLSNEISLVKDSIPIYVDILLKQIDEKKRLIENNKAKLKSIYIGGGTPSCIDTKLLSKILSRLAEYNCEFTFEAGRAETIKEDLLKLLQDNNVNRISINPQTFSEETLKLINRKTSIEQITDAFSLAKKYNLKINSDLIVGLDRESQFTIFNSLKKLIDLNPDNITLHSLSIKRGSKLFENGARKPIQGLEGFLIDCYDYLKGNGYIPYYLYRLKNSLDNSENIGFSKYNSRCIYNILNMEDASTIYAAGAGAIEKRVDLLNHKIDRISYPKNINQYIKKFSSEYGI